MNKRRDKRLGCALLLACAAVMITQIMFLTLKAASAVSWSWLVTFSPILAFVGIIVGAIAIAVLVMLPKEVTKTLGRRRRLDREAETYGMKRQQGETDGDLKKRIVRRNMIAGNYSRKEIKDIILEAFPTLASCQFEIDNGKKTVGMIVRRAPEKNGNGWIVDQFTDGELRQILEKATDYIPPAYNVMIRQAKEDERHGEA